MVPFPSNGTIMSAVSFQGTILYISQRDNTKSYKICYVISKCTNKYRFQ